MSVGTKNALEEIERVVQKELSESEASCLTSNFVANLVAIGQGQLRERDILSLYIKVKRIVKSKTKSITVSKYTFDGVVPSASLAQSGVVLQYVVHGSQLFCAKIGSEETIAGEVAMAQLVHESQSCPTVMPILDTQKFHDDRLAMITPFYPMNLSLLSVEHSTVLNVALCAIATVKAFSNKRLCHGDIKPSNMMLQCSSKIVVTIDFGSCLEYGSTLQSTTPIYALDCPIEASLRYDLTCVATTIIQLSGQSLDHIDTRDKALKWLSTKQGSIFHLAKLCLQEYEGRSEPIDQIWYEIQKLVELVHKHDEWLVDLDSIWPVAVE